MQARESWQREQFIAAMGLATTPVTVVSTDGPAGRVGQTVSAMCSVSADPPTLLVCIHGRSPLCQAISANGCFSVNLLTAGQAAVSDTFAGRPRSGRPYDFGCASWIQRVTGAPVLNGAAATFDCQLAQVAAAGTHRVFFGTVLDSCRWPGESLAYRLRAYGGHRPLDQAAG